MFSDHCSTHWIIDLFEIGEENEKQKKFFNTQHRGCKLEFNEFEKKNWRNLRGIVGQDLENKRNYILKKIYFDRWDHSQPSLYFTNFFANESNELCVIGK